jgi:low temperature requirement protein LtrA
MTTREGHAGLLRRRGEGETRVEPIELFFDLVFVLAVTQLTQYLLDHLSLRGAGEALLLLLAVWSAWIYTGWFTNYFDPDTRPVRLMLVGVMLASLIMSASLPEDDRAPGRRGDRRDGGAGPGRPGALPGGQRAVQLGAVNRLPRSRLVAICALAALVPLAVISSALVLLLSATAILVALALWDMRAERHSAAALMRKSPRYAD